MAYSVDVKVKIIGNVGRQLLTDGGYKTIFEAQRVSDGKRLFLWTRTIVAGGVTRNAWFYSTKTSVVTDLQSSVRSISLEPALDLSTFMDEAKPDFVVYDSGEVSSDNITNDAGNRLRNLIDTSGNVAFGTWLGDGVSVYPYADSTTSTTGSTTTVYNPTVTKTTTASTGLFGSIQDFISQNPLTSTVIGILLFLLALWAWNEYEEKQKKGKGKKRR